MIQSRCGDVFVSNRFVLRDLPKFSKVTFFQECQCSGCAQHMGSKLWEQAAAPDWKSSSCWEDPTGRKSSKRNHRTHRKRLYARAMPCLFCVCARACVHSSSTTPGLRIGLKRCEVFLWLAACLSRAGWCSIHAVTLTSLTRCCRPSTKCQGPWASACRGQECEPTHLAEV